MVDVYTQVHRQGFAHSIEAWLGRGEERRLVGGIYGVSIGAAFFAESMFCRPELGGTDASKVCLVELVGRLRRGGYTLLDVQLANPHTEQFGVIEIPSFTFQKRLAAATKKALNPIAPELWGSANPARK
jgi:leucyl/phenylalanyl-tRNA--protein transferase